MDYQIIRSRRKTLALQINERGEVILRGPLQLSDQEAEAFVKKHLTWIEKHRAKFAMPALPPYSEAELEKILHQAHVLIPQRVAYWAERTGISYGRISIRRQKTRWGSCSSKGNLNFNCTLVITPAEVMDYVIIHELCHRKQMNHSPKFWQEVAKYSPNHKACQAWLKAHSRELIGRLP